MSLAWRVFGVVVERVTLQATYHNLDTTPVMEEMKQMQ